MNTNSRVQQQCTFAAALFLLRCNAYWRVSVYEMVNIYSWIKTRILSFLLDCCQISHLKAELYYFETTLHFGLSCTLFASLFEIRHWQTVRWCLWRSYSVYAVQREDIHKYFIYALVSDASKEHSKNAFLHSCTVSSSHHCCQAEISPFAQIWVPAPRWHQSIVGQHPSFFSLDFIIPRLWTAVPFHQRQVPLRNTMGSIWCP